MKRKLLIVLFAFILSSCGSMPETIVKITDTRPQLAIKGAPPRSILYIDGLKIGEAHDYNGNPKTLVIEPGSHLVTVKSPQGDLIHNQKIFVESELKVISVKE